MRWRAWATALSIVIWTSAASAESADARAARAADAASLTARKIRKTWDGLRASNPTAAACVEDKVARAIALGTRVERRRIELREATDDKARSAGLSAIEALDAQRIELEAEATACVTGRTDPLPMNDTKVTVKKPSSLPSDAAERELVMLVLGLPMLGR